MHPDEKQTKRAFRGTGLLLFLIYFVQKIANHTEGLTKLPLRSTLMKSFGMDPAQAGTFLTNTSIGFFIKPFWGIISDNVPIFGYRRKSWLIITSLLMAIGWIYVALVPIPTPKVLFLLLTTILAAVAFADVVCDGYMVQRARRLEKDHHLPEGTGNRPLQVYQWIGAFTAMFIAAIGGGVIAQFFTLKTAAALSAIFPILLLAAIATSIKEERINWSEAKPKRGLAALVVITLLVIYYYWVTGIENEGLKVSLSIINNIAIIGIMLLFVRVPKVLIVPILFLLIWHMLPFHLDSQYAFQFLTQDAAGYIATVNNLDWIGNIAIAFKLTTAEAIKESGLATVFLGSILGPIQIAIGIITLILYYLLWSKKSLRTIFAWCMIGNIILILLLIGLVTTGTLTASSFGMVYVCYGAIQALMLISVVVYAAARTPEGNEASIFALLMGVCNIGDMVGKEICGGAIYKHFTVGMITHLELAKASLKAAGEHPHQLLVKAVEQYTTRLTHVANDAILWLGLLSIFYCLALLFWVIKMKFKD